MDDTATDALEAVLLRAIARHRAGLRREAERQRQGFEQCFLFARLGLSPGERDAVAAAPSAAALPPDLRHRIEARLVAEAERLSRLGRVGSARYDLNRHLSVHHSLAWLRGEPATPKDDRLAGHVVNARFRRPRRRRRRAARPAGGK